MPAPWVNIPLIYEENKKMFIGKQSLGHQFKILCIMYIRKSSLQTNGIFQMCTLFYQVRGSDCIKNFNFHFERSEF